MIGTKDSNELKEEYIVIIGDGEFAEIAYEYFTYDSPYKVVAFAVEKEYMTKESLFGLPVVSLEEIERLYPKDKYKMFTAITFTKLNRVRTRLYNEVKAKGYKFVSYVSSKAFVWRNAKIGENTFIFENNVIQYNVNIGKLKTKEIDFMGQKENEKLYIQVTYLLASNDTVEREFAPLKDIKDNYPKYVLSMDNLTKFNINGIERKKIIDFLLEQ